MYTCTVAVGAADIRNAQLGIQVHVVVPGQPVGGIQLAVRQCHHLGEAGVDAVDLVDHPLRRHDVHIALDLHRSVVDPGEALARALARPPA